MAYCHVCPEAYKSDYLREINETHWKNRTLLNRSRVVSALRQVLGSYLVPTLRRGQERLLPWTACWLPRFSAHALPSWPKGHTNLELVTSLLMTLQAPKTLEFPSQMTLSPFSCPALVSSLGLAQRQTEQLEYPLLAPRDSCSGGW